MLDTRTLVLYNTIKIIGGHVMETRLLKSGEVAEILQVSKAHAYVLMKRGVIPSIRIGKIVRVRLEDLERYINEKAKQNENPFNLRAH